jgi:hypothetical protein
MELIPEMNILGLHGVHSSGRRSTDKLLNEVHKQSPDIGIVTNVDYDLSIFETYSKSKVATIVDSVYDVYQDGDVIVTHSAGAIVVHRLLAKLKRNGRPAPQLIFMFNAALNTNIVFDPNSYGKIVNVCDTGDWALFFAQFLPFNDMGQMGRIGYKSNDPNKIKNIMNKDGEAQGLSHGDYFSDDQIERVASHVVRVIKKYLF